MGATAGGAGPGAAYVTEPLAEPAVELTWTSDRELDRLVPLVRSLRSWSGVYERWRRHELAAAQPGQAPLGPADLTLVDQLRGVHFGQLAAASQRLRQAALAAARLAESAEAARSALAHSWRDAAAQPILQRFDQLVQGVRDCAVRGERLGFELDIAITGAAAPVITSAVEEILARSRGWEHTAGRSSREIWERRITELAGTVAADPGGPDEPDAGLVDRWAWRTELDTLVTDYDAVIGLLRATLTAAGATVTTIYHSMVQAIASSGTTPFGMPEPVPVRRLITPDHLTPDHNTADRRLPGGAELDTGPAPASTMPASAGSATMNEPSAGSSFAGTGGGSTDDAEAAYGAAPGTPDPGSAVLGFLGESRTTDAGGATLGTLPDEGTGRWGSSAIAPLAGGIGATGFADPQRAGRHWTVPTAPDEERDASWARLRALLGEESGEHSEPDRNGP